MFNTCAVCFLFIASSRCFVGLKEKNIEKVIIEKGNDDEEEMNENKLK